MLEVLINLVDPVVAVFYNRKSLRMQRLEFFFTPIYQKATVIHNEYMVILNRALTGVEQASAAMDKIRRVKNRDRRRRLLITCKQQLLVVQEQLINEQLALESRWTQLKYYHKLRRRRRLKGEEVVFMDVVLEYLYMLPGQGLAMSVSIPTIRDMRHLLRTAIKYHKDLYAVICEQYANLQLSVLG